MSAEQAVIIMTREEKGVITDMDLRRYIELLTIISHKIKYALKTQQVAILNYLVTDPRNYMNINVQHGSGTWIDLGNCTMHALEHIMEIIQFDKKYDKSAPKKTWMEQMESWGFNEQDIQLDAIDPIQALRSAADKECSDHDRDRDRDHARDRAYDRDRDHNLNAQPSE
jgi:hypothetical protein